MKLVVVARTDVGQVRMGNEDSFLVGPDGADRGDDVAWFAVADGMGGHQAGEVASAEAVRSLLAALRSGRPVGEAIGAANRTVFERATADLDLRGMGTTLTAAVFDGAQLRIGHVGDSRAYLWRASTLRQITRDHSLVAELIELGELTPEQAEADPRRSMITRALGIGAEVEVDVVDLPVEPGDRLLLCSDGLTTMVRDADIEQVLSRHSDPARAADVLVAAANLAGGEDNVTVVVADVVGDEVPEPTEQVAPATGRAVEPEPEPEPKAKRKRKAELEPEALPEPEAAPEPEPEAEPEPEPVERRVRELDDTDPELEIPADLLHPVDVEPKSSGPAMVVVDDDDFADAIDASALPAPVRRRRWWRRSP